MKFIQVSDSEFVSAEKILKIWVAKEEDGFYVYFKALLGHRTETFAIARRNTHSDATRTAQRLISSLCSPQNGTIYFQFV